MMWATAVEEASTQTENLNVLVPLVSVLVGAVIGGGASLLVERARASNAMRSSLLDVRRHVELEAVDATWAMVRSFQAIFSYNHDGTSDEADDLQASAFQEWAGSLDALNHLANRIYVLASPKVAELVQESHDLAFGYVMRLDPEEGKFLAAEINPLIADLRKVFQELKDEVRRDLGSAALDGKSATK